MANIGYEDYVYSSEDENQVKKEQDGYDLDETGSVRDSNHTSDEDENEDSNHHTDTDEYACFSSDYAKFEYDQKRWKGIANPRKYVIAKKKGKGEAESQTKAKARKNDKCLQTTKAEKQTKSKALVKSRRKSKNKEEVPLEPKVDIPKEGEIHFDTRGNLWYSYKKDGTYISERATFHHWIRADLSRGENLKGSYAFPRKRGTGNYNLTCFNAVEQHWGLHRPHYAPVMFEWERINRQDPVYPLDNLYHQGSLVIDYWRTPVRNFREIPLVISSAFEGGYMEPATRLHSEMAYEDIRARMPPFTVTIQKGVTKYKALSKASTFSGRSRHFREIAGATSWDTREGSDKIKGYIEGIVKPINNSTRGSRDLTKAEIGKMRLPNFGTKPGRAKEGTSEESKKRYKAVIKKAAGLGSVTTDLHGDQEYQFFGEPIDSVEDNNNQEDESMAAEVSDAAPPRFVFCCMEVPFLRAMTEEEALMHPLVDSSDPRNHVPKLSNEVDAIRDALKVTVDHFTEIFGVRPMVYEGSNYISEYCNIQDQMDDLFLDHATALRRLGRWEGTMFDWERAEVEHDPCFGRKQPS